MILFQTSEILFVIVFFGLLLSTSSLALEERSSVDIGGEGSRVRLGMKLSFDQALMVCNRGLFAFDLASSKELNPEAKLETKIPSISTWIHCPEAFKVELNEGCIITPKGTVEKVDRHQLHQTLCDDDGEQYETTTSIIMFRGIGEILKQYKVALAFLGSLLLVWLVLGIVAILDWRFWNQTKIYSLTKLNFVSVMAPHYVALISSGIYVSLEYCCALISQFPGEIVDSDVEGWLYFIKDGIFWTLSANILAHLWTIFWAGHRNGQSGSMSIWSLTDHRWTYFPIVFTIVPFFALSA